MKGRLLLAAIGMSLAGCAADGAKLERDHSYVVEWIGERPLMDYAHLTVTLGADGRAYGNGGCNHWFAPYTSKATSSASARSAAPEKCAPKP